MVIDHINKMIRSFAFVGRSYCFLYRLLGIIPIRYKYYKMAFTHNSASVVLPDGKKINNERMEFLGDSVLSTVICAYLYDNYPDWNEGELSKRKSVLVRRAVINAIAVQLGICDHIIKNDEDNIQYKDISGNTLEAIIGAVYLDRGYEKAKKFIINKIISVFESIEHEIIDSTINYKSILFEWVQKHHSDIDIKMISEPKDSNGEFVCEIFINGNFVSKGSGNTKKDSHQNASHNAIDMLSKEYIDITY